MGQLRHMYQVLAGTPSKVVIVQAQASSIDKIRKVVVGIVAVPTC